MWHRGRAVIEALSCPSTLQRVVVHARGALVSRRVALPEALPDGDVELLVEGVAASCEPGSVRASLDEATARAVVSVHAELRLPEAAVPAGPSVTQARALRRSLLRVEQEIARRAHARERLAAVSLAPRLRESTVRARVADALAASELIQQTLEALDLRVVDLERQRQQLQRDLQRAELDDAQRSSAQRHGPSRPTRALRVRLAGAGAVASLELRYVVRAARWWPVSTLRLTEQAKRAQWVLEALVAQRTGEDWSGVELALSTADLAVDARLPELPSLRLGRAQPPAARAWRPPPGDLEPLFAGFDRARGPQTLTLQTEDAPVDPEVRAAKHEEAHGSFADDVQANAALDLDESYGAQELAAPEAKKSARLAGGLFRGAGGGGGEEVTRAGSFGGHRTRAMDARRSEPRPEAPRQSAGDVPVEPGDGWLQHDQLRLGGPDAPARGRLRRAEDPSLAAALAEVARLERSEVPAGVCDPLVSRGVFDHRYPAEGLCDVPSDGALHRVPLGRAEAVSSVRHRCAPAESPEVYREVELKNPFDAPLLAGPVDVYADGSLVVVASNDRIDRGGTLRVGLGVEDRLRVARNVRFAEETRGVLGGESVLTTAVSVELSSALGAPSLVEVVDRVPVTQDKDVRVEWVRANPEPEAYTQAERGAPLRGGKLWKVIVPAGGKTSLAYEYRVTLPSKSELVGGNRRG